MRFILFILSVLWTIHLQAQIEFQHTSADFGDIEWEDSTFADFTFKNNGAENDYILSIRNSDRITYKLTSREIAPGDIEKIRIKYTPKNKGPFSETVKVFFGNEKKPVNLKITGNAKYVDPNADMACPDFINPNNNTADFKLTVKVVNKTTGEPIDNAKIQIIQNGIKRNEWVTGRNGEVGRRFSPNLYYFIVGAEGFAGSENAFYVNKQNPYLLFELDPVVPVATVEEIPETKPEKVETGKEKPEQLEIEETTTVDEVVTQEKTEAVDNSEETEVAEKTNNEEETEVSAQEEEEVLPASLYAPNNVVFLIDVSSSMNKEGKLDLLKASMIKLMDILRPIDKVSLVTYADKPNVIFNGVSAEDKSKLIDIIQELNAKGLTAGNKGIKMAYKIANDNFIKEGNNQILIATDGAFKNDVNRVFPLVVLNTFRGVSLSVIGIKNKGDAVDSMEKLARKGNGNYIHIENYETSQAVLVDEIKENSRKTE